MAEIVDLALTMTLEVKGLKDANSEAANLATTFSKLSDSLKQSGEKINSTFKALSEQLEIFGKNLQDTQKSISLFDINFDISKDQTGALKELSDAIEKFKNALVLGNEDAIRFLAKLIDGFANLINWVNENIPGLTQLITIFIVVGTAIAGLLAGLVALGAALITLGLGLGDFIIVVGVLTLIIAGITAGVIALVENWDALVLAAQVTWEENIVPILEGAAAAIAGVLGGIGDIALIIWEGVKEATSAAWEFITNAVSNAVSLLIRIFQGIGDQLSQTWEFVKQTAFATWEGIKGIVQNAIESIKGFFSGIGESLSQVWESAKESASNAWEGLKAIVSGGVDSIKAFFSGIGESLAGVWSGAKEKASEAWEGIKGVVSGAVESIKEFGNQIKDSIVQAFSNAFDKVKEFFPNLINDLKEKWDNFINSLPFIDFFKDGEKPEIQNQPQPTPTPAPPSGGGPGVGPVAGVQSFQLQELNYSKFLADARPIPELLQSIGQGNIFVASTTQQTAKEIENIDGKTQSYNKSIQVNNGALQANGKEISEMETAAQTAAEGGLNSFEGKLNDVNTAVSNLNLAEVVEELAGFDPSRFLPGFIKPFTQAKEEIIEVGDTIEQLQNEGGFFDGIKQGFEDFVESVGSNSELIADFFANTLSQMSQSFSDLFFNVLTGRFDDLKDLAKQTFEAILRAFLDLVAAIATRQIVISIAGAFGIDTKSLNLSDIANAGESAINAGKTITDAAGNEFPATNGVPDPTELDPDTALPVKDSGIGAGIGAGLLGISIGSAIGGIINSDMTGFQQGISFGVGAAGAVTGFIIGGPIGAAIGGFIGSLIVPIITSLFKKTPRLDIDFDSVKTEVGRRAAEVAEFLDPEFFKEQIAQISVKRGGVGLGRGGDEGIKDIIQEKIEETVEAVQAIIFKLPSDLAKQLSEALLNTKVDIDTVVKGERLLEFDAKGKEIKKKFEAFINGELQAKFLFAIRDFFTGAFEALGVLPENAQAFVDEQFERFKNAGSREERAKIGEEFLASFNAFVDAFNIVSGNVNDSIGQTIQSINSLSSELGFEAVPSIGELTDKLGELLENAELDPETVQKYADLRNAIVQGISDIINSITGLIGKISQLNSTIVSLGGSAVNIIPFLDEAQAKLIEFYSTNVGDLSLGEQEMFLDELLSIANAKLAEEQAAFQRAQEARQKAEEAQRDRIQKRIDDLNKEKDKINEVFQERIDALNEELRIAEDFAQLTESIRQTLDSILFSPESVLTGVEQVSALQSNIATLQAQLASTTDPEKQLDIAGRLEDAFKTLFDTAGDAFGVNSPEFVAIFDQVTGGLENLADFTEGRGRSVEEISAEIERLTAENEATLKSIDEKIEAAQERLANIGQSTADNTFHASQELTELFEFIRTEYMRILEERFAQLGEVSEFGFATEVEGLGVIAGLADESLTVLKGMGEEATSQTGYLSEIAKKLGALAGFEGGTGGFRDFGRGKLAILHGLEAVITTQDVEDMREALLSQIGGGKVAGLADRFADDGPATGTNRGQAGGGDLTLNATINIQDSGGDARMTARMVEDALYQSVKFGRLRGAVQEAARSRI